MRASKLTRRFGDLTAVDHLDLEIPKGEIFGLVGPDGAGKTTTLRLLCGLLDPSEGEAWVAGLNVKRDWDKVKDQIGYMAQRFGLYGDLTVRENMVFYPDLFGIEYQERERLLDQMLQITRMKPFGDRGVANLPGGMTHTFGLVCYRSDQPEMP